ncbi:MAG: folate-binding protein YgfZ [Chloroflexi bacterium]|nr:folate-binding protein YgfZ [Chloroflexota bacterium]
MNTPYAIPHTQSQPDGDPAAEYAAARSGAVVIRRGHEGRVRAVGRDRLDLLHRMSTNDLTAMAVGEARFTVLTTPIARIVDVLWVLNLGETVLCLTSPGKAAAVRRWLAGYIFYNDQVKFEDASDDLGQLGIYGPRAGAVASALIKGAEALAENRCLEREGLNVLRGRPLAGDGFTVIAPADRLEAAWGQAVAAGATPAGEEAYQMLRLAAGQPYVGRELTDEYIPLEANLWSAVSFSKGCYIGQEIIARMESRGKLARRLAGVRLEAPVAVGAEVRAGEAAAGSVTSAGTIPGLGPVALSYLKTAFAEPDTRITVEGVNGTVVALPFVQG